MDKPLKISKWKKEFLFLITPQSPRYESLRELEGKLNNLVQFIDNLNRDNKREAKFGIEVCKQAIGYTDKLVEFFGFAEGNTPEPINFDQAYETVKAMLFNVQNMNVEINFFRNQENQNDSDLQHDQSANKSKITTINITPHSKIHMNETTLQIIYKEKTVFLKSKIIFQLFKTLALSHGQEVDCKTLFNLAWEKDLQSSFEKTDNNNLARKKLELTKLLPKDLKIKIESRIKGTYVLNFI